MGLQPSVVDIPISTIDQVPPDTAGPLGRLQHIVNGQVTKYLDRYAGQQGVVPESIRADPRDGFLSLTQTGKSVYTGMSTSPDWSKPELLAPLERQLVAISNSTPNVFNGQTWSVYGNAKVLTNQLSQSVFHTSQRAICAPDSAWLGGVTCSVWTELIHAATGAITTSYVGFKSDDGAWVVAPQVLISSGVADDYWTAKVVSDGSHFFVVFNVDATNVVCWCMDTNGALLAQTGVAVGTSVCGAWDIIAAVTGAPNTGTVILASAVSYSSTLGVKFVSLGFSGGVVTSHASTDSTIKCRGPVSWLTNDTGNGLAYLATAVTTDVFTIWAYEITALAQTHEYNPSFTVHVLDSITGYATTGIDVVLSVGALPLATSPLSHGPPVDPGTRVFTSVSVTRGGTATTLRTTQAMCQVSRAFKVDGNYYIYAYYQSGSGQNIPTSQNVTINTGDFMYGAASQPITVQVGDFTEGSPIVVPASQALSANTLAITGSHAGFTPGTSDFVTQIISSGFGSVGIPDGTILLKWKFATLSATSTYVGSQLVVSGTSVSGANGTWDIVNVPGTFDAVYTWQSNTAGTTTVLPNGFFTAAGSVSVASLTAYILPDISTYVSDATIHFFRGNTPGTLTVTGSTHGNNISGVTLQRVYYGSGRNYLGNSPGVYGAAWVLTGSQTVANDAFTATISPNIPNAWSFAQGEFDFTYIGADLVVTGDPQVATNVGVYPITSVSDPQTVVTSAATAVISQIFQIPLPTASIQLTTQIAYTFKFASLTPNYQYQGALVSVQGAANPNNNGVYKIIQINADGSFIAIPTNGLSNQVNEAFGGSQTVTIFFAANIASEFQPTWFLVPLTGSQPVVGRFEYGLAFADWRIESSVSLENEFQMSVSGITNNGSGLQVVLPYRAQNVTSAITESTSAGQVQVIDEAFDSTVGIKQFTLSTFAGRAFSNSGELSIPGPMATSFTQSGFFEDGIGLAPEEPFLVSQSVASSGELALTANSEQEYVVVFEQTDENGDRIFSPPSPALVTTMSGTNNVATIGGRLMFPLGSDGLPLANFYGPLTRNVTISIYRTAFINGVPTTQHYKITNDLNVNALAPVSADNPSGFSFPDSATWQYIDQNPDGNITANEILYTDKGLLARYSAPANRGGCSGWGREFVFAYDGAVWMSGEKTEGDAIWFTPAFRFTFPSGNPIGGSVMDDYLIVFCDDETCYYIPRVQFPDSTGQNGTLPSPIQLPFQNGSASGFALTIREGVVYDSSAGGLWLVSRNLQNEWLSHPVVDTLTGTVTGVALDSNQRLGVIQASGNTACVYDGIPRAWYEWGLPSHPLLMASYLGQLVYQDSSGYVNVVTPGQVNDQVAGVTTGIAPSFTLAPFNMGNVRGLKRVWEFQIVGIYRGAHNINATIAYPQDGFTATTFTPKLAVAGQPYVYPFNPRYEEAAQFQVVVWADFNGLGTPGGSFSLEMISAQVGLDPVGLSKRPAAVRLVSAT